MSHKVLLEPSVRKIVSDFFTPAAIYTLFKQNTYSFLLESVEKGKTGRYSFIGFSPKWVYRLDRDRVEVLKRVNGGYETHEVIETDTPLNVIEGISRKYYMERTEYLPPFCGGLVGYAGYEIIATWEKIDFGNPASPKLPLAVFCFIDEYLSFDHLHNTVEIIKLAEADSAESGLAGVRLDEIHRLITSSIAPGNDIELNTTRQKNIVSNFTKPDFEKRVEAVIRDILNGEIIQGVFSQRLETDLDGDPFDLYRALRVINPSPYMFYLKMDDMILCGSSPEIMARVNDGYATVRPIAGTRPRGENPEEEGRLETELMEDIKEKAEHIMLVDLGRNDLGRVCRYGTVKVNSLMEIEKYSHVMHMVSDVTGRLNPGVSSMDVYKACFPAGTVSGAPKIRAIEIIDREENLSRGPYAGSVGYFSFTGDMDMCITIRTMMIYGKKIYVQAGAGIVADSVPEKEYYETMNKAKALLRATEMIQEGKINDK